MADHRRDAATLEQLATLLESGTPPSEAAEWMKGGGAAELWTLLAPVIEGDTPSDPQLARLGRRVGAAGPGVILASARAGRTTEGLRIVAKDLRARAGGGLGVRHVVVVAPVVLLAVFAPGIVAHLIRAFVVVVAVCFGLVWWGLRAPRDTPEGLRLRIGDEVWRSRFLRPWVRAPQQVRLLRVLAPLLDGGWTLSESLDLAGQALGGTGARRVAEVVAGLGAGEALGEALARRGLLDPVDAAAVTVAEETGRLPEALARTAGRLELETARARRRAQVLLTMGLYGVVSLPWLMMALSMIE